MKKNFKYKSHILIFLIILLGSFLRLWMLGDIPVSLADDEIRQTYTSFSIAETGKDYFGNLMPLVFSIDGYNQWSQVTIYIGSLFFKFFELSPFSARLPYALAGILSILFFYLTAKELFKDKIIALIAAFALSVSIWQLQISRIAMDINFALLMYIVAIFLFLKAKKNILLALSMVFFFLAFYSYGATKVIFFPLIPILIWFRFKELKKKQLAIILAIYLLTIFSYLLLSVKLGASSYAGNPFFFQNKEQTSLTVELKRRSSDQPPFAETIFMNKYTVLGKQFLNNYLNAFSPQYLFLGAEKDGRFAIWDRGEIYLIEIPFLLFGILSLYHKRRKLFYLNLLLFLIAPLPSGVAQGVSTWVSRSAFMIYPLYIFIAFGVYSFLTIFKNKKIKYVLFSLILLIYCYEVLGYLYQYYFDWSRTNSKYFSQSTKELVQLIDRNKEKEQIIIASSSRNFIVHLAFYTKIKPEIVQEVIAKDPIKINNVIINKECVFSADPREIMPENSIYIEESSCKLKTKPDYVIKEPDQTEIIWKVYEN